MIERTMEISCPEEESKAATGAPHLPPLDAEVYEGGGTSEQIETIRAVHDYLTQHLSSRVTIDELSRMFLIFLLSTSDAADHIQCVDTGRIFSL